MAEPPRRGELGCAAVLVVFTTMLAGLGAFTLGRIGDFGALRHAWPWVGLIVFGGVLPAALLRTVARRSHRATLGLTLWMLVALFLTFGLAINSGGGV